MAGWPRAEGSVMTGLQPPVQAEGGKDPSLASAYLGASGSGRVAVEMAPQVLSWVTEWGTGLGGVRGLLCSDS